MCNNSLHIERPPGDDHHKRSLRAVIHKGEAKRRFVNGVLLLFGYSKTGEKQTCRACPETIRGDRRRDAEKPFFIIKEESQILRLTSTPGSSSIDSGERNTPELNIEIKNAKAKGEKTMKATNEIKNQIREAHEEKQSRSYNAYVARFIKPAQIINTEKEEQQIVACGELAKAEKPQKETAEEKKARKEARKLEKKVNTKKELLVRDLLKDSPYQTRRQNLVFLIKRAEEETAGELAKEEPSNARIATLSAVIEDSKNELELFKKAEADAERFFRINNEVIYCKSLADLQCLDDEEKLAILHRSIRYKIKQANAHVDKEGNSAPLPKAFIVDEPYFNAHMDEVTSIMWIKLSDTWNKYRTNAEYAEEINSKAEAYNIDAFRIICGRSADSALDEFYNKEVKGNTYKRKVNGQTVLCLDAYQAEAPEDWETERTAVLNVYLESIAQNEREEKVFSALDAGYTHNEIAEMIDVSRPTVSLIAERMHTRIQCDRMTEAVDQIERAEENETARENDKYILRTYIMKAVSVGMSYSRIADHMRISDSLDKYENVTTTKEQKIQKMLKGVDVQKLLQVEHLKPQTLPRVPRTYARAGEQPNAQRHYRYSNTAGTEAEKARLQTLQEINRLQEIENAETARAIRKSIIRYRRKNGQIAPEAVEKAPETARETVNRGFTDEALQSLRRKLAKAEETEKQVRAYRARMRYINSPECTEEETETA